MTEQEKIEFLATKVMGWERWVDPVRGLPMWIDSEGWIRHGESWNPLQNIADAWMLVDKFKHYRMQSCVNGQKYCEFLRDYSLHGGHGHNQQEAICNAALKAVGVNVYAI